MRASILNASAVRAASAGAHAVVHLAAMSRVLPSLGAGAAGVRSVVEANVDGTAEVLQAAVETREGAGAAGGGDCVRRFVYAGSSTYYGSGALPNAEGDAFAPSSPYALAKHQGELLVRHFAHAYGLPALTLRLFQVSRTARVAACALARVCVPV